MSCSKYWKSTHTHTKCESTEANDEWWWEQKKIGIRQNESRFWMKCCMWIWRIHRTHTEHPSSVIYHYLFSEVRNLINMDCIFIFFNSWRPSRCGVLVARPHHFFLLRHCFFRSVFLFFCRIEHITFVSMLHLIRNFIYLSVRVFVYVCWHFFRIYWTRSAHFLLSLSLSSTALNVNLFGTAMHFFIHTLPIYIPISHNVQIDDIDVCECECARLNSVCIRTKLLCIQNECMIFHLLVFPPSLFVYRVFALAAIKKQQYGERELYFKKCLPYTFSIIKSHDYAFKYIIINYSKTYFQHHIHFHATHFLCYAVSSFLNIAEGGSSIQSVRFDFEISYFTICRSNLTHIFRSEQGAHSTHTSSEY